MARILVMIPSGEVYDHDCVRWYRHKDVQAHINHYHNIGDAFVFDSSLKLLNFEALDVLKIRSATQADIDRYNAEFDYCFLRGSNYIHGEMVWDNAVSVLERLKIPILAFGIGAQAPARGPLVLSEDTKRILHIISHKSASIGVRGINLAPGDRVISMAILSHVEAAPAERAAYLRQAIAELRSGSDPDAAEEISLTNEDVGEEMALSAERYEELKAREQFVLTVSEYGYGKRSSSYDFRVIGRGGKGIRATDVSKRSEIGPLVAAFPVGHDDQIMLVTSGGQVIRVPVHGIRIASRATKGVKIFNIADGDRVVSVERISEPQNGEGEQNGNGGEPDGDGPESAGATDA